MTNLTEQMQQVRLAYRLVVAYQRRLLDLASLVHERVREAHPRSRFSAWGPSRWGRPGTNDPTTKWAWDFVPLHHCDIGWRTAPLPAAGEFWFWLSHEADTGWQASPPKEPDPLRLRPVEECETLISATVLAIPATTELGGDGATPDWQKLYDAADASTPPEAWVGALRDCVTNLGTVRIGGLRVPVHQLGTREQVTKTLVEPLLQIVRHGIGN